MNKKIGIIGTGELGSALAGIFLEKGYELYLYNRTPEKANRFLEKGANTVSDCGDLFTRTNDIFIALFDIQAIEQLIFNDDVIKNLSGKNIYCITSLSFEESEVLQKKFSETGAHFLDIVVLSSAQQVAAGQSHTIVGGPSGIFEHIRETLEVFSPILTHVSDEACHASVLEIALLQMLLFQASSYALGVALIRKTGAPFDAFIQTLDASPFAKGAYLPYFAATMGARSYDMPVWKVANMAKSIHMYMNQFRQTGVGEDLFNPVLTMTDELIKRGFKDKDFTSLFEVVYEPGK